VDDADWWTERSGVGAGSLRRLEVWLRKLHTALMALWPSANKMQLRTKLCWPSWELIQATVVFTDRSVTLLSVEKYLTLAVLLIGLNSPAKELQ
jgi:hypothetical protein